MTVLPPTVHGTAVASPAGAPRRAVLLTGPPGAGKSDLALRLLDRGWQLVADDRVVLTPDAHGRLLASAPATLAGRIEARGVGLLHVAACAGPVPLALVLDLSCPPERLPQPAVWPAPEWLAGAGPVPQLGLDPRPAAAPLLVEQALRLHGLCLQTSAAMPESLPPVVSLPRLAVSGMSGAGRSTALKALEDLGYEVVDNMPLALVDMLLATTPEDSRPFAFGIDSRTRGFDADQLASRLRSLKAAGQDIRLFYLDCADDELIRRFSETRRRHPLALDRPASDGIARERELTAPLRRWADLVIDTTGLKAADLRQRIADALGQASDQRLTLTLQSFGFAHGLPQGADLVFDMRFLANPHWDPQLRPLTGEDPRVAAHVAADPGYEAAVARIADLLVTLIPGYVREGKAYLTIAIGCTGGRHRSVAVARDLLARLAAAGHIATLGHRDLHRDPPDSSQSALTNPLPEAQPGAR
jgi:UPF0042 nucleotide-binding protein